jgi:hypothetical protein
MALYLVSLKKIKVSHNRLRSDEIKGTTTALPRVGKQIVIVAEALDDAVRQLGGQRHVNTSTVVELEDLGGGSYKILTESGSIYQLTVLAKTDDGFDA